MLQFETKMKPSRRLFVTQSALFVGIAAAGRICDGQLRSHDLTVVVRRIRKIYHARRRTILVAGWHFGMFGELSHRRDQPKQFAAGEGNRTLVFSLEFAELGNANNERSDILQPYVRLRCLQNFQLSEWLSRLPIEETRAFGEAEATASGIMRSKGGGPSPSVRRSTSSDHVRRRRSIQAVPVASAVA
jgi:hypothetical protein